MISAVTLILTALRDQIVFFYSPTEIHEKAVAAGTPIRLGGLVKDGSWTKTGESNDFVVTDGETEVKVTFVGILPDLFREGQGVVVGRRASSVPTMHLRRHQRARQARRELHAQGSRRGAQHAVNEAHKAAKTVKQ